MVTMMNMMLVLLVLLSTSVLVFILMLVYWWCSDAGHTSNVDDASLVQKVIISMLVMLQ